MKCKAVVKDETSRMESPQTLNGEEQRTITNSTVANDATGPEPEALPAADVHKGKYDAARHT